MASKMAPPLKMFRHFLSEVRRVSDKKKIKESPQVDYVFSQMRKFQVTELQHCHGKDKMKFLLDTYVNYIQSTRKLKELTKCSSKGSEKTVDETANIFGYKLPHDPK